MLIPLIIYPYLIRVLGGEFFGLVLYAQASITYFSIFISFGFNVSATKEISVNRNNPEKISEIVSSVLTIKAFLYIISLFILLMIFLIVPLNEINIILYLLTFANVIFDFLFPTWYFQGVERMKHITIGMLFAKSIPLFFVFFLIKGSDDYLYVPILNGIGSLACVVYALYILFRIDNVKFRVQPIDKLVYYIKDSFYFFTTSLSINVYSTSIRLVVGRFLGLSELALFDLAEKIVSLSKLPYAMLGQAVLPKIAIGKNSGFIRALSKYVFLSSFVMVFFIVIFSDYSVRLLGGSEMFDAAILVKILGISLIPAMYKYIGLQALATWGFANEFFKISLTMIVTFLTIVSFLIFTNSLNLVNLSISAVVVEFMGAVHFKIISLKRKIFLV
jgi:PST family polysaccharide transporter